MPPGPLMIFASERGTEATGQERNPVEDLGRAGGKMYACPRAKGCLLASPLVALIWAGVLSKIWFEMSWGNSFDFGLAFVSAFDPCGILYRVFVWGDGSSCCQHFHNNTE